MDLMQLFKIIMHHVTPMTRWELSQCNSRLNTDAIAISREHNLRITPKITPTSLYNFIGVDIKQHDSREVLVAEAYETLIDTYNLYVNDYHLFRRIKPELTLNYMLGAIGDLEVIGFIVDKFVCGFKVDRFGFGIVALIERGLIDLALTAIRYIATLTDDHAAWKDEDPETNRYVIAIAARLHSEELMHIVAAILSVSGQIGTLCRFAACLRGEIDAIPGALTPRLYLHAAVCGGNVKLVQYVLNGMNVVCFTDVRPSLTFINDEMLDMVVRRMNADETLATFSPIPTRLVVALIPYVVDTCYVIRNMTIPLRPVVDEHKRRKCHMLADDIIHMASQTHNTANMPDVELNIIRDLFIYEGVPIDLINSICSVDQV